jgi:choline dehydrogenase-like flavoprotein
VLIDIGELPAGTAIAADVCIVGAGPAGLTLGRELRGSGLRVVILESGGPPRGDKRLGDIRVPLSEDSAFSPPPHVPPSFGGAANEWVVRLPWMRSGVRVVPLSPIDLEERPWIPHSGWPITWDELRRYYLRANAHLGLAGWGYEPEEWDDERRPTVPFPEGFTTAMERFANADFFTRDVYDEMKQSGDLTVFLNAPVGHIGRRGDSVDVLEIDSDHARPVTVTGRVVVLACGGLRNAQILFNADEGRGIGNAHGVLGRYYMDHLRVASGSICPSSPTLFRRLGVYDLVGSERGFRSAKIVPTAAALEAHGLLHSAARFLPNVDDRIRTLLRRDGATGSLSDLRTSERLKLLTTVARSAAEMSVQQRRFPPRVDAGWSRLSTSDHVWSSLAVEHQIEQAPDARNRVVPSDRVDRFGRRQVRLEWGWTDADLASLETTLTLFARAVDDVGLGRFERHPWEEDGPIVTTPDGAFHPTGATRMSATPRAGVVDADSRVHGTSNLFVLGSSVFPTGGYANPVLTVIALAVRLGDLLRRELTTPTASVS